MQVFVDPQQAANGSADEQRGGRLGTSREEVAVGSWAAVAAGSARPPATSSAASSGGGAAGSGGSSPGSSSGGGGGGGTGTGTPHSASGSSARSSVSGAGLPPLPVGVTNAGRLYTCDVEGWPATLQVLCEHMEHELPFYREPLSLQLESMAAPPPDGPGAASRSAASRGRPPAVGPALSEARLVDLHPASWFAVAWYPVYRIPDAPLTARFLCFYSLAGPLQLMGEAEVLAAAGHPEEAVGQLQELRLPIVGLKWCDLRGERWFEPFSNAAAGAAAAAAGSDDDDEDDDGSSSEGDEGSASTATDSSGTTAIVSGECEEQERAEGEDGMPTADTAVAATAVDGSEIPAAAISSEPASADADSISTTSASGCGSSSNATKGGGGGDAAAASAAASSKSCWSPGQRDLELQARLAELQATAERLARGGWLKVLDAQGPRALKLYHSDFEFFNSRSG